MRQYDNPERKRESSAVSLKQQNKNLVINRPGDRQEKEAESIANKIAGAAANNVSHSHVATTSTKKEGEEGSKLVNEVLQSAGRPLQNHIKNFMESRFGYDFSHVRIHDDGKAAQSAQSINAKAYTHGKNIVFNKNTDHTTVDGRHLLAHELSHIVQQSAPGAATNLIQRQPLSPDVDTQVPAVDMRETVDPYTASALGSVEVSRFKTGSAEIPAKGKDSLRYAARQIVFFMQKYSLSTVTVKGHTDKVGTEENNASLGQQRADAVKEFLIAEGVPEAIITTESKGESIPAVSTKDNVANPENRRVEVRFSVRKSPVSFGMDLKLRPPQKQVQVVQPPQPPKIDLKLKELPKPVGPVRDVGETELWKKMEDIQKQIDAYDKANPRKTQSLSDVVIDGIMDNAVKPLLKKIPISDKLREKAESLIRDGIESGIEKSVDAAIDALPDGADKEALKQAVKAALKQK
ncbi:MAG: DUF4157 domain-containing protein [Sphingobacteriaceae bacterium]|nr:MAG: DUF4157 domain-containing protein [Sphingobacteriaceae bacterium]